MGRTTDCVIISYEIIARHITTLRTQDSACVIILLPLAGADIGAPLATGEGKTFLMFPARLLLTWGQGPHLTGVLVTNFEAWNLKEVKPFF